MVCRFATIVFLRFSVKMDVRQKSGGKPRTFGEQARRKIEGNAVTILISSSDGRAQRLASEYRNVGGGPANAIDHRGHVVYVWELASSPTQRQTVYDCYY